jgi:class 3 adenylate cyclase
VVFADLAGFTSRAERLDPEDVGRLLTPFYTRVRGELERFGGTVEKFIGDAVMAVFGAPVAHEDDPERAVRAAFGIRAAIEGLNASDPTLDLHVRVGIATGEVFVQLGADPARGETSVAGDVVNTAARLQQSAPVDAIIVGDATRNATTDVVEYRRLEPIAAKGKREPVPVWEAVALPSRPGFSVRRRAQLVGRQECFPPHGRRNRARVERSADRLAVGDAGLGKSRLAWELHDSLHASGEPFVWRHGRSLPYGAGVTFWAFAEIVKAQAGILETDPADVASERLHASVEAIAGDTADARWIERHLGPLVGLGGESGELRESFAAWRRYIDGIARASGLLVLGLEDLQWADDGMLDFIEIRLRKETPVVSPRRGWRWFNAARGRG